MPQEAKIFTAQVFKDVPATFLGKVLSLATGKVLVAADVASISWNVYDIESDTPDTALFSGTVTVATGLHALKLDLRWSLDSVGFNFDHTLPAGTFPLGGRVYALKYLFTAIGDINPSGIVIFHVHVLDTRGV